MSEHETKFSITAITARQTSLQTNSPHHPQLALLFSPPSSTTVARIPYPSSALA